MNTTIKKTAYLLALLILSGPLTNAATSVDFNNSASFTDIEDGFLTTDKEKQRILESIRDTFQESSNKYLPEGYNLKITVNDVDLAGDTLIARSQGRDLRLLTDLYPPRIKFDYQIVDPQNKIVHKKNSRLRDLNYLWSTHRHDDSPAYFVSELIEDWARQDLRAIFN